LLLQSEKSVSFDLLNALKISAIELLSHGLEVEITELSATKIEYKGEDLGSLKLNASLKLHKDENLASKILFFPFLIFQNLDFRINLSLSKKMYKLVKYEMPYVEIIPYSSKQHNDNLFYAISYIDGNLIVNGKKVF